jgi:hypothetical protein
MEVDRRGGEPREAPPEERGSQVAPPAPIPFVPVDKEEERYQNAVMWQSGVRLSAYVSRGKEGGK